MIIAAAQTIPIDGNIEANLNDHVRMAELAATHNAELLVFPEMSLTGYQREGAGALAFTANDERLGELSRLSVQNNMVIIAGAPIRLNSGLHIGAFALLPNGTTCIYTKQFLHEGEELFFTPCFEHNPIFSLGHHGVSLAICADIANPIHPTNAAARGATLYAAGIFYTPEGIGEGHNRLSGYAKTHSMHMLMANYGGPSYRFAAGGRSAVWDDKGNLSGQLEERGAGLLIAAQENDKWQVTKLSYS